jgi:dTDP-4-dehydrorhamnose 3,5-epimerase
MKLVELSIPEVKVLAPRRFEDQRGFFSETYSRAALAAAGIELEFVQDNESLSRAPGVVRGLHYQLPLFAQAKLVRVLQGAILDVALDIRRGSPTFGRHVATELSAQRWNQILVPVGFAHGFCTLVPDTRVFYKVSAPYAPEHERGILWNDAALGIDWPVNEGAALLSAKDRAYPPLRDATELF